MSDKFRRVDDGFWVSPQIGPDDVETARALGVRTIINNRPDGEEPDQTPGEVIKAAAEAAGLAYVAAPVSSGPTEAAVEAAGQALKTGPVLAFCRSGTRSILVWAISEIMSGAREREDVLALARNAGYDLSRWI